MKVLVTGGAGFIGSHTVEMLLEEDFEVVVFDNLSTGHRESVHPNACFIEGDLTDHQKLRSVFVEHDFQGVFHFASYALVGESMSLPWKYLRDNVLASANLLECCVDFNVNRLVCSSTSNLFSEPESMPIMASNRIKPASPYGESKAMIERQIFWMSRLHGLRYSILRYFNAAGAHPAGHIGEDHDPETHLIPIILEVALQQREHIQIFGTDYDTEDGTCIRDFVHVVDLASAHILTFRSLDNNANHSYNLGSGVGYSIREVINAARVVTGRPIPAIEGARRPGDPPVLVADNSDIQRDLGWNPTHSDLHSIIESAWKWRVSHPHGYQ